MAITILDFLHKLDENLTNSLNSFQTINKYGVLDIYSLHELIQNNNQKLYKYLECLKQLESLYFSNKNFELDNNQFIMAFNIDNDIYNKNFTQRFIDDSKAKINIFKLKKFISTTSLNTFMEKRDINVIESINISPNSLNLPVVKSLKDVPSMFYWYDGGDTPNKRGIYASLSPGFCVRIPLPNTISTTNPNFKLNSIPCKYETREDCIKNKKKISEIYKSEIRECFYVHRKEKFSKIGSFYRCNIDSFGSHDSLVTDMNRVNVGDIKRILMYALSDALLSTMWYQNKFKDGNLLLNNLETY